MLIWSNVLGVVPNAGHFPDHPDKEFQKLLTIGPMSRYAQDLKPALKIMAGVNADILKLDEMVRNSPYNWRNLADTYYHCQITVWIFFSFHLYFKVNLNEIDIYYMLDKGFVFSEISVDSAIKECITKAAKHFQISYGCSVQKVSLTNTYGSIFDTSMNSWLQLNAI